MSTLFLGNEIDLVNPPETPNEVHARLAVVMLCVWGIIADGELKEVEFAALGSTVSRMPLFEDIADDDLSTVINEARQVFFSDSDHAPDWAMAVCNRAGFADVAYYMVLDVIFSDGEIADNENRLAKILQVELDLSDGFAKSASDCMRAFYRAA